ncbi:MAG TPA: sensor histidine kinase [Thermoanaerobaculia bacterium]|nr:sensor histidine kinase [Thermoanaerobaculia bacterium]
MPDAQPRRRRYPFLPPESALGWTPYVWLIYLGFFVVDMGFGDPPPWELATEVAALVAFLPLYFWGYWLRGRRVLVPAAAIALIGAVCAPFNFGAAVFFIYAAAFLGESGPPRRAVPLLLGLTAALALEAWWLDLSPRFWIPGVVFSLLIGGVNIHFAELGRAGRALRRSREEVERLAKRAERERIARDLHDLLGHTLSVITLKAELAGKLLPRDPEAAGREIREIEATSRQALAEVREAVTGYRAVTLAAELEHTRTALEAAGVEYEHRLASPALDPDRERVLALALREAVTNVVRHAAASRCRIVVEPADGGVRLEVADDGRGGDSRDGSGLSGMRERVAARGGWVERRVEGGTRLVVFLPEPAAPAGGTA